MVLGFSEADIEDLSVAFQHVAELESVVLFGSRAKGTALRGSDVDLALKGKLVTDRTVRRLVNALEESALPYFFDIAIYQSIQNQDLIDHIDRVGVELYRKSTPN
jgi:predicted nucleotidyltransferase